MTGPIDGGCACGGVRYRLASPPIYVHCCHCTDCQRRSGTAFAVNALIESDRVELLAGEPRRQTLLLESGQVHAVLRCDGCGATLWSHHPLMGERIAFIPVGTLDAPGAFPPAAHCFTRTKLPWVILPEGAHASAEHYDPDTCWPPESHQRLRATLA